MPSLSPTMSEVRATHAAARMAVRGSGCGVRMRAQSPARGPNGARFFALARAAVRIARAQGTLGKWKKAVGDKVVPGDILAEIQTARAPRTHARARANQRSRPSRPLTLRRTHALCAQDKATMEMESMEEGYVARLLVADGTEGIPVGKARSLSRARVHARPEVSYGALRPPRRTPLPAPSHPLTVAVCPLSFPLLRSPWL
jgi:hypothetical protein